MSVKVQRMAEVEERVVQRQEELQQGLEADRAARIAKERDASGQISILLAEVDALATRIGTQATGIGASELVRRAETCTSSAAAARRLVSTGGATGGSTRPQKVESEQMAEMVALLRQMLSNDNRGARVAVLG